MVKSSICNVVLLLAGSMLPLFGQATPMTDATKTEEKALVLHQVQHAETVYSIAKIYGLKVEDIAIANKTIGPDYAIEPEQILQLPVTMNESNEQILNSLMSGKIYHTVRQKETLYSIVRAYPHLSIKKLKTLNHLEDNAIALGQKLLLGTVYANNKEVITLVQNRIDNREEKIIEHPVYKRKPHQNINKQQALKERYRAQKGNKTEKVQSGAANWFKTDNRMMTSNYYALFNDAPAGTVLNVTNEMNQKQVFVKVIGKLPENAENAGVLIKLTPAAQKILQNNDEKLRVAIRYYP